MGGSGVEVKKVWLTNADHPGYGYGYEEVEWIGFDEGVVGDGWGGGGG